MDSLQEWSFRRGLAMKRIRILYVILAVLVVASTGPLIFYAFKMIAINRQALETNEKELQNTTTHSIAEEISIYNASFHQLLDNLNGILEANPALFFSPGGHSNPQLRTLLEQFVSPSNHIIYVTLLDAQGRGVQAGNYKADADPFLVKVLGRAFAASQQRREYQSDPVLISQPQGQFPVMVVSVPIIRQDQFRGMLGVVVDLDFLVERLRASSTRGLEAFVVDRAGRLVLTGSLEKYSIGQDMAESPIVQKFLSWGGNAKASETSTYDLLVDGHAVPMVGTYWPVQSLQWGVIAQKKRQDAFVSVDEMISATSVWGAFSLVVCLGLAYLLTLRIVEPIRKLTESSRAIARGDFTRRIHLRSRTAEIGELASTFNLMSSELEQYVAQLKDAAEKNRQLFLDSIRMIATAVDERDPYTHGHSERVTRYSVLIAKDLGLPEEEIDRIRISALLHDVGKIGIEDKILKKPGMLTPEEFEIMKQHPTKGANILRRVTQLTEMIPGVELHHESVDGHGYPYKLAGEDIPLMARIIAVADTFDAMTTHRPYQSAMDPALAIDYIHSHADRKFDGAVVAALENVFRAGKLRMSRAATMV